MVAGLVNGIWPALQQQDELVEQQRQSTAAESENNVSSTIIQEPVVLKSFAQS
jgi:hypothetical protein